MLRENTTTIVFLFREDLAGIIAAIEGTIGDGFEHVLLLDVLCAFQIGYRARDFQYTVIRTRREAQLGHRELQQLVRIGIGAQHTLFDILIKTKAMEPCRMVNK